MENNNVIDIRERILENTPETYKEEEVLSEQDAEVKALFESIKTPTALDITNIKTDDVVSEEISEDIEEREIYMTHDPVTGMIREADTSIPLADKSISEVIETAEENPENYTDTFNAILGEELGDKDVLEIINFMKMVEQEKPKKLYNILPDAIKRTIYNTTKGMGTKEQNEGMARAFYDLCIQELKSDQVFYDMDNMLRAEMKQLENPDYMMFYLEHIKEHMEIKIIETAETYEAEGYPEKGQIFRNISESFTEAYTYSKLHKKIKNKARVLKKELNKDIKDFNKICSKVNAMYLHSKFVITDTRTLLPTLDRVLPKEIDKDAIARFLVLLMNELRRNNPDDIKQHTYIYYSIKLINALEHIHSDNSEFKDLIIANIVGVINEIEAL